MRIACASIVLNASSEVLIPPERLTPHGASLQFPDRDPVSRSYDGRAKNRIGLVSALPGDPLRGTTAAVIILLLALIVFGAVIAVRMPYSPDEAIEASSQYPVSDTYVWSCPSRDGYEGKVLEMRVDPDDFRHSMGRHMFRQGTFLVPDADAMANPDDRFVHIVAEHTIFTTDFMHRKSWYEVDSQTLF